MDFQQLVGIIEEPITVEGPISSSVLFFETPSSAPTDECIALAVAWLMDNSQILPLLLSQTISYRILYELFRFLRLFLQGYC